MSWLERVKRPRAAITTSHQLAKHLATYGRETDSGAVVSPEAAMQVPDVWGAVRVFAETMAQLPLILYRETPEGRERAKDHWLYTLLHDQPNGWQTSFEFRETLVAHQVLYGGGFAIKTVVGQEIRELIPVTPDRVTVKQVEPTKRIYYEVQMPAGGPPLVVPQERMFHVPGISWDSLTGLIPYLYQRESIGLAIQLRKFAARFFKNGAALRLVLTHPGTMSDEAYKRLNESFDEEFAGASQAHRSLLTEEGVTVTKVSSNAEDAQLLESRRFAKNETATANRLQPHLLGDMERATHSNIEQQSLEFIIYTMAPWFARWEQRIRMSLIPERERKTLFAEFLLDSLLRGDTPSRYAAYQVAIQTGFMSRNEARQRENWNKGPAELDEFLTPTFITGKQTPSPGPTDPQNRIATLLNGNGGH